MTEEPIVATPPVEEEFKEYKDKYLLLLADMENARKRMQKEKHEMIRFGIENVMSEILGPIDSLENALKFTNQMSDETRNWSRGFEMILEQFKEVLVSHGVTAFDSVGNAFDPYFHDAVETEETDQVEEGTILKEFVRGYKCGDRVLRVARVKVAKNLTKENKE